jgi:hypothetical protein
VNCLIVYVELIAHQLQTAAGRLGNWCSLVRLKTGSNTGVMFGRRLHIISGNVDGGSTAPGWTLGLGGRVRSFHRGGLLGGWQGMTSGFSPSEGDGFRM